MQDCECTFDYVRYEENDNDDFKKYYQDNVDPTARPLAINVDYSDALSICYSEIIDVLNGTKDESELPILENHIMSHVRHIWMTRTMQLQNNGQLICQE